MRNDDMQSWPGCRPVTGMEVEKPHLRLVTNNDPDFLPGNPPHLVLPPPAPEGEDDSDPVSLLFAWLFVMGALAVVGGVAWGFKALAMVLR